MRSAYDNFSAVIALYHRRGVSATTGAWSRLWADIARAYAGGRLSDREHDELFDACAAVLA